jgi:NADPH:quinone reductase-like Zn-dependent oxidoreductase
MHAVAMTDFGAAPALLDLPRPEPADGEVLVRVHASSVNGFDGAVAAGYLQGMMEHRFPLVLGKDFAGTVELVSPGVSRFAVGEPVFGVVMKPVLGDGAFGEYVTVPEGLGIARRPDGLDVASAGVLGLAGTAALQSVDAVQPLEGQTVLVSGATGGVGAMAVQLAAARGARVIATARAGDETHFVRSLGAAEVVDYTGDVLAQVRLLSPRGVDAVLHFAGDGRALADLLVSGGRFASTLGVGADQLRTDQVTAMSIMAVPATEVLERLASEVAAGRLRLHIARTYRLEEAPQALADFGSPHVGKLAIAIA